VESEGFVGEEHQQRPKALFDIVGSKTLPVLQKYRMTSLIP